MKRSNENINIDRLMLLQVTEGELDKVKSIIPLLFFGVLALLQVPLFMYQEDAVGLFDVVVVLLLLFIIYTGVRYRYPLYLKDLLSLFIAFIAYVTLSFLIAGTIKDITFYSIALVAKQYQFLIIAIVSYYLIKKTPERAFHLLVYAVIVIITINGFYKLFVDHSWYRLGLPFKLGTSSNPAGFILATSLLVMLHFFEDKEYYKKINKLIFWTVALAGYASLILTISRTNNFAFLVALFIYLLIKLKGKLVLIGLLSAFMIFVTMVFIGLSLQELSQDTEMLYLILNPRQVLEEGSFIARYAVAWFYYWDEWQETIFTMLFGIGFGTFHLTDSLYFTLLYSTGIIGFLLYLSPYFLIFKKGGLTLRLLVVVFFINSINAETTLMSYRTMQVFIIYLVYLLVREYDWRRRLKNKMILQTEVWES